MKYSVLAEERLTSKGFASTTGGPSLETERETNSVHVSIGYIVDTALPYILSTLVHEIIGKMSKENIVEQAVVYSTTTTGLSTLTFEGGVVVGGGVEERSEVMYWHRGAYIIYYRDITGHSCIA